MHLFLHGAVVAEQHDEWQVGRCYFAVNMLVTAAGEVADDPMLLPTGAA